MTSNAILFHPTRAAHWYSELIFKSHPSAFILQSHYQIFITALTLTFSGRVAAFALHCDYDASLIAIKKPKLEAEHSQMDVNGWITAVGWKRSCAFLAGTRSELAESVSFISLSSRQRSITATEPVILVSKQRQQQGNIVFGLRRQRDH